VDEALMLLGSQIKLGDVPPARSSNDRLDVAVTEVVGISSPLVTASRDRL